MLKPHKIFKLILILCFFITPIFVKSDSEKNKFVIGCERAGFFSIFWGVLNHLAWCERNNKIPVVYWDNRCTYYQASGYHNSLNAWEYYFEPVSALKYKAGDRVVTQFAALDNTSIPLFSFNFSLFDVWLKSIKFYNELILKYIKIKKPIETRGRQFYQTYLAGKKTIGIHLRGTDKHLEIKTISPEILLDEANKYIGFQYFVATDEQRLFDLAKKKLKGPIIAYNSYRSINGSPIHHDPKTTNALRGEEVLIETLILAQCNLLIHSCSNVSISCYYFNPSLKGILFTPNHQRIQIN